MNAPPTWIRTSATITACTYQTRGLSTLAFGFQTTQRFRITCTYYAHARLYTADFQSPTAIPQGETIPLHYNPLNPAENDRAPALTPPTRTPIFVIGITGSILLSLAWLLVLRSCH